METPPAEDKHKLEDHCAHSLLPQLHLHAVLTMLRTLSFPVSIVTYSPADSPALPARLTPTRLRSREETDINTTTRLTAFRDEAFPARTPTSHPLVT